MPSRLDSVLAHHPGWGSGLRPVFFSVRSDFWIIDHKHIFVEEGRAWGGRLLGEGVSELYGDPRLAIVLIARAARHRVGAEHETGMEGVLDRREKAEAVAETEEVLALLLPVDRLA